MGDKCIKPEWHDRCCCNCQSQRVIFKHPWNKGDGKGRMTDVMGFGCDSSHDNLYEGIPAIIFMDARHGMCEMHELKVPNVKVRGRPLLGDPS